MYPTQHNNKKKGDIQLKAYPVCPAVTKKDLYFLEHMKTKSNAQLTAETYVVIFLYGKI
jgi:hypothetical protein